VSRPALRETAEALLREATGAARVVRLCPRCGSSAHGQPRLVGTELRASIAYAAGLVTVAWAEGPVGIDVEPDGPPVDGVGDRLAWTRTEALAKATGHGLVTDELPDLPTQQLPLPVGYVGTVAGTWTGWKAVPLTE